MFPNERRGKISERAVIAKPCLSQVIV